MLQFLIGSKLYTHRATAQFDSNYLYFDPFTGEAWARIIRRPGADWAAVPAGQEWLAPYQSFPQHCPGSLVSPLWQDQFLWHELPPELLHRELSLIESAVARLQSGNTLWYNSHLSQHCPWSPAMQPSIEVIQRLAEARLKLSQGNLTNEELRAALADLRAHRVTASEVSAKSRSAKAPIDTAALLDKLLN